MNRCKKCGIYIKDETNKCPFCEMVLTSESDDAEDVYPDVRNKTRFLKKFVNVACYFAIVLEIIFIVVNYYNYYGIKWSAITGGALLYFILTLQYSFSRRNGHIRKIFVQMMGALLLIIGIDNALGYSGWSVDYGIPSVILLMSAVTVICMLVDFRNWQSYILMQVFTVVLSIVQMVLYFLGKARGPVLPWVSFGVSSILFTSCLVIGGKKAKEELRRRFYI